MESMNLLTKLIEIEDILGVEDSVMIHKKIRQAQDCLMQMLEHKYRPEPPMENCARCMDPVRPGWRAFLEAYAPEFTTSAMDGSEFHNFSGGWGAPRR